MRNDGNYLSPTPHPLPPYVGGPDRKMDGDSWESETRAAATDASVRGETPVVPDAAPASPINKKEVTTLMKCVRVFVGWGGLHDARAPPDA